MELNVPYGSGGWKYYNDLGPVFLTTEPVAITYDDSAWAEGMGVLHHTDSLAQLPTYLSPFTDGSTGTAGSEAGLGTDVGAPAPGHSFFNSRNGEMWVRRWFPPGTGIVVKTDENNYYDKWIDEVPSGSRSTGNRGADTIGPFDKTEPWLLVAHVNGGNGQAAAAIDFEVTGTPTEPACAWLSTSGSGIFEQPELPLGALAGDLGVLFIAHHALNTITDNGWTLEASDSATGVGYNNTFTYEHRVYTKTLVGGDTMPAIAFVTNHANDVACFVLPGGGTVDEVATPVALDGDLTDYLTATSPAVAGTEAVRGFMAIRDFGFLSEPGPSPDPLRPLFNQEDAPGQDVGLLGLVENDMSAHTASCANPAGWVVHTVGVTPADPERDCAAETPSPPLPCSDCEPCTELGCCDDYTLQVTWGCGGPSLGILDGVSSFDYERIKDDVSSAHVHVDLSANVPDCCDMLGDIRSWCHELHIFRCGEPVWSGPITRIESFATHVNITARDIGIWLDRTGVEFGLDLTGDLSSLAYEFILANSNNTLVARGDGCPDYEVRPTGIVSRRKVDPEAGYVGDVLREWARQGLDFTVLGRNIVLFGSNAPLATIGGTLTDADFIGELGVLEDGMLAATAARIQGKGVVGAYAIEGVCGTVEVVRKDDTLISQGGANLAAKTIAESSWPAPLSLIIPDGVGLSPTAPVCLNDLVPGVNLVVASGNLCRNVTGAVQLTRLFVAVDSAGEKISVTLSSRAEPDESGEFS